MARCVNCGEEASRPVWAVYADDAFARKSQVPFPLHMKCFNASETITATRWELVDQDTGTLELVESENAPRYRKVEAP